VCLAEQQDRAKSFSFDNRLRLEKKSRHKKRDFFIYKLNTHYMELWVLRNCGS